MCDTNKAITKTKLLRPINISFITRKYKNNNTQTINAAYNKSKTSYKLSKANNPLDSVTGVTNNNIYNYGHGKYHLQVTFTRKSKQNLKI